MNQSEFQKKISEAGKPVVIDFWATWCAPCMMTKPILEKLGREYDGKVKFMPINADDSRDVLEQFKVFGIPTVITLRDGKEVGRVTGAQNEAGYRAMFEALAEGKEVKVPMTTFDRILRLGAGAAFLIGGISSSNWLLAGIGAIIAFLGFYDRCPIWQAIIRMFKK
jgi:thioredoxin 1